MPLEWWRSCWRPTEVSLTRGPTHNRWSYWLKELLTTNRCLVDCSSYWQLTDVSSTGGAIWQLTEVSSNWRTFRRVESLKLVVRPWSFSWITLCLHGAKKPDCTMYILALGRDIGLQIVYVAKNLRIWASIDSFLNLSLPVPVNTSQERSLNLSCILSLIKYLPSKMIQETLEHKEKFAWDCLEGLLGWGG